MRSALRYSYLAFELNHLLDDGVVVDIGETRTRLDDGSVLGWLEEQFGEEPHYLDLSMLKDDDRQQALGALNSISSAVNARKKFGVEKNGICLLVACCLQVLQGGPEEYEAEA